ncbi:TetR/AcrR family transcriptional regulator [Gordonia rhizosphera]|uniref:Putative TetR family transcriptional regulator n=1 Tax=Gordonia rhizosphera NBRC 16068 TaxID=1108045 RepID=K6WDX7_9ACTN|nr:TetR/AcrR family transcriptional regulator [Gordonia rhizosphera]GAB90382.1 putative TetR family transcriptional regulator [Gordonia rhizosphera NBRC 16068]
MASRTTRAENRAAMEAEIRRLGREHLRTHGAAGLSLRAIARDLGVVSSAVYRYVPSRDELLTLLLVEAYSDLADAVEAALAAGPDRPRQRLVAATRALRRWAVDDPSRWALLYGSPVPGYAAPPDVTIEPGTRVVAMLIAELGRAHRAGLVDTSTVPTPASLTDGFAAIRAAFDSDLPDAVLILATTLWATVIGAISLEVFGQYGPDTFADPAALFDAQVDRALQAVAD